MKSSRTKLITYYLAFILCGFFCLYQKKLPRLLVTEDLGDEENLSGYPDAQIGSLRELVDEGKFSGKRVGIWKGYAREHDDSFALQLAYKYFSPRAEPIKEINKASETEGTHGVDYVISPWEVYPLSELGDGLVYNKNWLFVYKISTETTQPPIEK